MQPAPQNIETTAQYPRLIVVMGVCGCGKSTIAEQLAATLDAAYLDGDDYHPEVNIAKMSRGEALNDEDRWPWLRNFATSMSATPMPATSAQESIVIGACSALRRSYRDCLTDAAGEPILFVLLDGSKALISERMAARKDHFMPDSLLDSQFATLERPQSNECAFCVDISGDAEAITRSIVTTLQNFHPRKMRK